MPDWRSFGATNAERTCLWCGQRLRPRKTWTKPPADLDLRDHAAWRRKNETIVGWGDYGEGFFCGLRCAYQYAEALAKGGRRLRPKDGG